MVLHFPGSACLALVFGFTGFVHGQSVAEQHIELRATLDQWMEAVDQSQELENRWERENAVLQDSVVGLKEMLQQAEADIAEAEKRLQSADQGSREKLEQQEEFNEARDVLREDLGPVEAEVAKVVPLFPDFYVGGDEGSAKLKSSIEELSAHRKAESQEKQELGLNARLQPLVQILTDAERFHSKLWTVTHPLKVGEVEKQMNVLYFGLSVAYAVDDAGSVALFGKSSQDGWEFQELNGDEMGEKVLALYKAADGSGESRIVSLPLSIDEKSSSN